MLLLEIWGYFSEVWRSLVLIHAHIGATKFFTTYERSRRGHTSVLRRIYFSAWSWHWGRGRWGTSAPELRYKGWVAWTRGSRRGRVPYGRSRLSCDLCILARSSFCRDPLRIAFVWHFWECNSGNQRCVYLPPTAYSKQNEGVNLKFWAINAFLTLILDVLKFYVMPATKFMCVPDMVALCSTSWTALTCRTSRR